MSTPYSHSDSTRRGEWDTPLHHHQPSTCITTAAASPAPSVGGSRELVRASDVKVFSALKQEVLSEEEYLTHLSSIIKRDFFPHLKDLEAKHQVIEAFESGDQTRIQQSVRELRSQREGRTPRVGRSSRRDQTPGRTPYSESDRHALTPTYFDRTPITPSLAAPSSSSSPPLPIDDPTSGLSLDAFQSRYTSEDNSSFAHLLARDNQDRRDKHAWAWQAEKKANERAVRGRSARERLVEVTREMVEASGDGSVRMLEGVPGKPGVRRLVVNEEVKVGENDRLLIRGREAGGPPLLITAAGEEGTASDKGKGKEVDKVDEKAKQYVDWDRATAEEVEEEKREEKRQEEGKRIIEVEGWPFKNRNSLMFPPDADRSNPSSLTPAPTSNAAATSKPQPYHLGEPKGIRHAATRLVELEKLGSSRRSVPGSEWTDGRSEASGTGPSRSRIGAAVAGTPYPNDPSSSTPRLQGFSFVDALPSPTASSLPASALQELMTWGTIEATPVTLRTSSSDPYAVDAAVGPFKVRETDRREELAHKMAKKAKRSLSERLHGGGGSKRGTGMALEARPGSASTSALHKSVLHASVRSATRGGGATLGGSTTPRATASDLSPAARSLLSRTQPGRAIEKGLRGNQAYSGTSTDAKAGGKRGREEEEEEEKRRRRVRAERRAREVESEERLRRGRWTPSPAPSLGFDPDLEPRSAAEERERERRRLVIGK
ncbi:hypothetical protein JCM11641_002281 [Rhodosporidiobolus odoratus]